jgi:uncharacterized protein (DUF1778 family)
MSGRGSVEASLDAANFALASIRQTAVPLLQAQITGKATMAKVKMERLEARIAPEQKKLLERAANLRGTTLTNFVVASAQQAATATISEFETLTLHAEASRQFADLLLNPPKPNDALRAAAKRHLRKQRSSAR